MYFISILSSLYFYVERKLFKNIFNIKRIFVLILSKFDTRKMNLIDTHSLSLTKLITNIGLIRFATPDIPRKGWRWKSMILYQTRGSAWLLFINLTSQSAYADTS